jgi:integrase
MPLQLKTQRDGRLRDTWYGRYEINSKKYCVNLGVKIMGTPPASLSLRDQGDTSFEVSRANAAAKLKQIIDEARTHRGAERLVEKLYEIKTGEKIQSVKLNNLPAEWMKIPRKRKPDDRYALQCQATLLRFVRFVHKENPKADEIAHVTRTIGRKFLESEEARRITAKTWNDTLVLLRATFQHLLPAGSINPFSGIPTRETETIFRKPFSPEELKTILNAAREDEFIRPVIVTGICTAMRRGDCCLIKKKHVDLKRRFITVKTAKTGEMATIPIFPLLFDELKGRLSGLSAGNKRSAHDSGEDYVFPEQAEMYLDNPDGITWRVKKVLMRALAPKDEVVDEILQVPEAEARRQGLHYISQVSNSGKRNRMLAAFDLYMSGKRLDEVVKESCVSKGSVSGYLNEIELATKCRILRGKNRETSLTALLKNDKSLLRIEREDGERMASVWDFHSFRVTWVTLALTAGVPLELVQKVTGHKTTTIVLKHYFQPGREDFRRALQSAMPKLLTNGEKSPKEEIRELIEGLNGKLAKEEKLRLLNLLEKV